MVHSYLQIHESMQQHVGAFLEKCAYTTWLQSDCNNLATAQSSLSFMC